MNSSRNSREGACEFDYIRNVGKLSVEKCLGSVDDPLSHCGLGCDDVPWCILQAANHDALSCEPELK